MTQAERHTELMKAALPLSQNDNLNVHVARQRLSDGSHVYDVFLTGNTQIIAVDEKAAWKIADTLRDMLDDDAVSLTPAKVTCNY